MQYRLSGATWCATRGVLSPANKAHAKLRALVPAAAHNDTANPGCPGAMQPVVPSARFRDGPKRLANAKDMLSLARDIRSSLHDHLSPAFAGMLNQAIGKLEATVRIAPTNENLSRIRAGLASACDDIRDS